MRAKTFLLIEPFVLWFTGLPSAGKTTLARAIAAELQSSSIKAQQLDGDLVREVFPSTGFNRESRDTHVKQMGFMASLLERNGVVVVASFVSPYCEAREFCRKLCSNFVEVHLATSVEECVRRDVKGMYKQALAGEIANFTGISDPYEPPADPEIRIDTAGKSISDSVEEIFSYLAREKFLLANDGKDD